MRQYTCFQAILLGCCNAMLRSMITANDRYSGNDRNSGIKGPDHFFHYSGRCLYFPSKGSLIWPTGKPMIFLMSWWPAHLWEMESFFPWNLLATWWEFLMRGKSSSVGWWCWRHGGAEPGCRLVTGEWAGHPTLSGALPWKRPHEGAGT